MSNLPENILKKFQDLFGENKLSLHEPIFNGREKEYLTNCIDCNYVSSVGAYVDEFENRIAEYTNSKRAICVVNGTSALFIAIKINDIKKNEEVLLPSLTFVATANAISYNGSIPHFIDSSINGLGVDTKSLESWLSHIGEKTINGLRNKKTGRKISGIVPMHTFGHPCDMEELLKISNDYNLTMIEDAAESLGSFYDGKHTGTFGNAGILSFNGNKIITTGGGGAIITDNVKQADYAKHLTTTAKVPHKWNFYHDEIGYNFRMPNINAALGCAQMEQLNSFIKEKRKLFMAYKKAFTDERYELIEEPDKCKSNYWLNAILIHQSSASLLEDILDKTNKAGYMTRPVWKLISTLPAYLSCPSSPIPNALSIENKIINIPSSVKIAQLV